MATNHNPMIAVVWTQFTAYHTDRCIALTARLRGRAEVVAVEVASTSHDYGDFSQTGEIQGVRKVTLFPGESFDEVAPWRRFSALFGVLLQCRIICLGVPYSHLEVVLLAWLLRLLGKKLVMLCDSKFDDRPRAAGFEFAKRLGLSCFNAAIFASARSKEYLSFLGFANRPLLPGYDGVGIERYRNEATQSELRPVPFAQRDLLFIGRFVQKKNLSFLIRAYARYVEIEGDASRRLVLVGSGPLENLLRMQVADLRLEERVVFAGFREGTALAGTLKTALGLILVSAGEQWGLVVNEASALGVPVILSESPGARDVLVRNLVTGYILEQGSTEGLVRAMQLLGKDELAWNAMSDAATQRAWLGDAGRFVDSVELLFDPQAQPAGQRTAAYVTEINEFLGLRVIG